jgi:hypothetical protein
VSGLTIHFRLRFAVAVTLAAFLVISLVARRSFRRVSFRANYGF